MASDSDDDFERFLQEDDSASVSSASPVKKHATKDANRHRKHSTTAPSAKSVNKKTKAFGGSSLSVVAAAEKLLAGSARARAKKKQEVDAEDEDDEEPPPSYSADPYAFDLGDATSGYARKSDDDKSDETRHRGSSRRSSKTKKTTKGENESDKTKKSKSKANDKEALAAKGEAKPAKTLDDRIAEILKRTGSTAYPSGNIVSEKESDGGGGSDDQHDDSDAAESKAGIGGKQKTRLTSSTAVEQKESAPVADAKEHDSDENSDLHRLSFSDSLGMESADFEVGALAKRKLDRSRLSLSSLNSEKFAVNMDALEDSGHASQNRYDQQHEGFNHPAESSDPGDSDYGDDGFELDQTTEALVRNDGGPKERESPSGTSYVSQFESMKSIFSLESPIKPTEEPAGIQQVQEPSVTQVQVPPESDNFGYDDEFETEETDLPPDSTIVADSSPHSPAFETDEYGDEEFEPAALPTTEQSIEIDEREERQPERPPSELALSQPVETPMPFKFEVVSQVMSVTETTFKSPGQVEDKIVSREDPVMISPRKSEEIVVTTAPPSPPKSPPPPPPPDDHDDEEGRDLSPPAPKPPVAQTRAPTTKQTSQPLSSTDRLRKIEHQVSTLRFLSGRSSVGHQKSTPVREFQSEPEARPIVDDPETLEVLEKIEKMMKQAKRARQARRASVSRSSVKENELAFRLQQAQRQLLQFKQDVEELAKDEVEDQPTLVDDNASQTSQASNASRAQANDPANIEEQVLSRRSMEDQKKLKLQHAKLKKEMESQERLIQGFQRENELLMKQLKQLQRDVQYDVHKENESLRVQLKELRTLIDGTPYRGTPEGIDEKVQYRSAIEARLQAEALAGSLQEELKAQERRHQGRINELKIELEKVKKAKIDLEYKYEGISIEKMEAESREIKVLKEQLLTQKAEHDHVVSALQKKIDWYVKNQRLLDEQDEKINSLKEENKLLKAELSESGADKTRASTPARSPKTHVKGSRLPADVRRIQELESRLSEMEEAMRRRHPDSLVSLIVSSRKADDESKLSELMEEHKQQVDELIEEMENLQAENEKKLNTFRQQQEKLVLQYQKQITDLEHQLANKENSRGGSGALSKTPKKQANADADELYRVRRFYAEKIKEVERKWEAKYRAVKKQHYAASGTLTENFDQSENSPSDSARIIRSLQQRLASKEEEIRNLRGGSVLSGSMETGDLRRRILRLEAELKTSEDARRQLIATITSLNAISVPVESQPRQPLQEESQRERELEARLIATQQEHEQSVRSYQTQIKLLEQQVKDESTARHQLISQIASHVKEVERFQKLLTEAEHEKRSLQQSAERVAVLESEVAMLREQLSVPQTPSMLQFRSLELRIETLTQKHQLREAELKMLLAQATQSSQLEKLNYERMYQNAIALKNAEIHKFKKQLGEILDELETLRRAA